MDLNTYEQPHTELLNLTLSSFSLFFTNYKADPKAWDICLWCLEECHILIDNAEWGWCLNPAPRIFVQLTALLSTMLFAPSTRRLRPGASINQDAFAMTSSGSSLTLEQTPLRSLLTLASRPGSKLHEHASNPNSAPPLPT